MNFSFKLKEVRKKKGLKQEDLASLLNIKQQQVSKYEKSDYNPSLERLIEIAVALDVTLDELVEIKKTHAEYSEEMKKGQ